MTMCLAETDTSVVGGFPAGDHTVTTPDQEVSKAAPEATNARPEGERTMAPEQGPSVAGNVNCPGSPGLLDCSLMTGEELDTFVTLSICSGVSAEIAALAEIRTNFSARCGRGNASEGAQGEAPEVMITGANNREAVIRGVDQLVQEIEAREDALARASFHAEEAINKAATDLSHQWSLFSIMWKSMEKKNKGKQDELAHREQQLAAREAEMVTGARDLEL